MSLNRVNPKRDQNEAELVAALRAEGVVVTPLSGKGVPDLLCGYCGIYFLVEVKMPGCKFTPAQREYWEDSILCHGLPAYVLRSPLDIERMFESLRKHYKKARIQLLLDV